MKHVTGYRLCVDDAAGTTVIIVKAACGNAAGSPADMSLTQVAVPTLPAAHKRPQAQNLHRQTAACARCGGIAHQLSSDSEPASTTDHTSKAIKRRYCRSTPPRGSCSGLGSRPEQEKR